MQEVRDGSRYTIEVDGVLIARCDTYGRTVTERSAIARAEKAPGYWRTVGGRLLRDPLSMICALVLLAILLSALFAPWLGLSDPYQGSMIRRLKPIGTPAAKRNVAMGLKTLKTHRGGTPGTPAALPIRSLICVAPLCVDSFGVPQR